ncbi:DUF6691 family protein [Desulfotalea psychrophila]|uniref:Hypothetical membrane protein n=1 Tax=Desulfotalea psychrophila (strain LSv54 / DSM 12343) TaxID=177439 RepID=Q6ALX4_DESPS|nr:DUF6691 family protein [Desulfotalea psychrophila]CAG36651.1 hypothetical membrane protein [Desulfotalea psychrophila LSv54]
MSIVLAIVLGLFFGFVLQKIGAADPQIIIDMLRLKNLHLMKAILLAIGLSSLALFSLLNLGFIDMGNLSVKASYVGVIVGGAIMGLGWAISGFCPGTGLAALGTGRKDALFFVLGGLVGAQLFTLVYAALKGTFLFKSLGGKMTLAATGNNALQTFFPSISAVLVAGAIAIILILIAWKLPEKQGDNF